MKEIRKAYFTFKEEDYFDGEALKAEAIQSKKVHEIEEKRSQNISRLEEMKKRG